MVNLSDKKLEQGEIKLLEKGLSFIPKPLKPTQEEVQSSIAQFSRRLKLTYFFDNKPKSEEPKLFVEKSDWCPVDQLIKDDILKELNELETEANKIVLKNNSSNLTKSERMAIKSLKNDQNIIIKPADKGGATVIMNKTDYIKEANRQLSNTLHYKKLSEPIHPKITNQVNSIIHNLYKHKYLNKKQVKYLSVPDNPRNRELYLTPKIHKEKSKWPNINMPPGRPIISDCGSDTYNISEYIDSFLAPLATKHPSYIKDTPDFLEKIRNIKIPPKAFLATIDVDALYTNINNNDGLKTVKQAFDANPNTKRPNKQILQLLKLCLENNDFIFNKEWYLQIYGTAMGKKFAPNYANIFMANWEEEALKKCTLKPLCYFRFLDDIFIIWTHSEQEFWTFFNTLNDHHPTIKLKATFHKQQVDFLDVTVFKGNQFEDNKTLDTKVYFKPTDAHQLLHKKSFHPKHTFKGIIKSQIIRFNRICNNTNDFENACNTLFNSLKTRGYSSRFLRYLKSQTLKEINATYNTENGSKPCNKAKCKTCPFMTTTNHIKSSTGKSFPLKHKMNCQSASIIYAIQCKSCKMQYVGESSRTVHERLTNHRSDIKTQKPTPVAEHFNNDTCGGLQSLTITPLEILPKQTEEILIPLKELMARRERELHWMNKLKTKAPMGINKRTELPPPTPFVIKFSDQSGKITQIAKTHFTKIKENTPGPFFKARFLGATSRNKNLKDILVRTSLK